MREVCCVGVGLSKWGEVWERSLRQLFVDAARNAIKNSGVDHLDSLYVGCMSGGMFVGQEHIGALCADYLGMRGIPAAHVESACASGGISVRQAFLATGVEENIRPLGVSGEAVQFSIAPFEVLTLRIVAK